MTGLMLLFPFACGFIGFFTNWFALRMMFRPVQEIRIFGIFKLQGIVPKGLPTFAKLVANVVENELIQMDDIANAVDIKKILKDNKTGIYTVIEKAYIDHKYRIPEKYQILINEETLKSFQDNVFEHMLLEAPKALSLFMEHGQEKVGIRNYILDRLLTFEPDIMEKLVYSIAGREIRFIVWYGGIFGGILGFLQYALYLSQAASWVLPVVGGMVGLATNYLALAMLWLPAEPKRILGFTLQGAIPSRKQELLENIQEFIANDFLVLAELINLMIDQINEDIINQTFDYHINTAIPRNNPQASLILTQAVSLQQKEDVRRWVGKEVLNAMPLVKHKVSQYVDSNFNVLAIMRSKKQTSTDEFLDFLKQMLASEQAIIIAMGGILGALIGGAQVLFI